MEQKIIKIGSSMGVVLPKKKAEQAGFKIGQKVETHFDAAGKQFLVTHPLGANIDIGKMLETIRWATEFIERNRPALEALAKQ